MAADIVTVIMEIIDKIDKAFQNGHIIEGLFEILKKVHGIVYKRTAAEINGVKGSLVWDYIIWNEITFDDMEGNIISLFSSASDRDTEKVWEELLKKYGV